MISRPARRSIVALAAVMAVVVAGPVANSGATPPIWEPAFGPTVPGITDSDDAATTIPLGTFSFPFYGVTHTGVETFGVSSNGLVQFGPGNASNNPTGSEARLGAPKIAALWSDLNPSINGVDQGSVFANGFNDDGDPAIDRVVFTWDSALFGCESQPTCRARAQIQLFESGRIVFGYDGVLTNQAFDDYAGNPGLMPLIAKGGFVVPPGFLPGPPGIDYSEAVPFTGGDLVFEHFSSSPVRFDLDQNNLVFVPSGSGYQVTSTVAFNKLPEAGAAAGEDKRAPKASIKAGKQDLDKVISKGLKLRISCNEACFADVKVAGKSPKVKNAGSGVAELSKAGKRSITVKLNQAARDALARASKATFKVTASVFDEAGNKRTVKKTVTAK